MEWITTNIRFPKDVYMELKMEAAKQRLSVAQVIRERISKKSEANKNRKTEKLMKELKKIADENAKLNPGVSFSEKLIEMRYEQ